MLKKVKVLALAMTAIIILAGGSTFMTHAASNVDIEKDGGKVTYYVTDKELFKLYTNLMKQWNIDCEVKYAPKKEKQYKKYDQNYREEYKKHDKPNHWKKNERNDEGPKQPAQPWENNERPKQEEPKQPEQPVEQPQAPAQPEEKVEQPEQPAQPEEQIETPKQEEPKQEQPTGELNAFEAQVVELTNQERVKHGLEPLAIDYELSKVTREKSRDMAVNRYFSHDSPVYGSPFDMMRAYGISYRTAGENIAKGQRTPAEVVNAWMNSPGHRANILNPNFTHIGVGYVEQGNHWTQQFIGK